MEFLSLNHFNALLQIIKLVSKITDNFVIILAIIHGAIHFLFFLLALLLMELHVINLYLDGIILLTIIEFQLEILKLIKLELIAIQMMD